MIERALALSAPPRTRAGLQLMAGAIALARGELAAASSAITMADQLLGGLDGRVSWHAEDYLLLAQLRIELLTAQGRPSEALALAQASVHRHDLQASPRYAWPLLVAAARAAAETAVTPAAVRAKGSADAVGDLIGALRTEAGKLEAAGPVQRAQQLTWAAEVLRPRRRRDHPLARLSKRPRGRRPPTRGSRPASPTRSRLPCSARPRPRWPAVRARR